MTTNQSTSYIQKVEKGRQLKAMRDPQEQRASPFLWITFALIAAVGYAVSNTLVGEIAILGGVVARLYQNLGDLCSSFVFLFYESQVSVNQGKGRWGWFYDSFFKKPTPSEKPLLGFARQPPRKVMKMRVFSMTICGLLDLGVYWFFVKSYQLAHFAHLNQGILMSIFSLLPIMMSISFFFVFGQGLKKVEILGIVLSVAGVIVIAFSKEQPIYANEAGFVHPIWSILALIVSLTLIVIRYTLFKYEVERVPGANTSILRSVVVVFTGIPILIASITYWGIQGLVWRFFLVGFFAGVISNISNNLGL